MKLLFKFGIVLFLFPASVCFGQAFSGAAFKQITDALTTPSQDTTKPKTSTQSNLAVSDEGTPNDKPKTENKKVIENPIEKVKKNITKSATDNNSGSGTTSNLAVSDEGVPNTKNNNSSKRETSNTKEPEKSKSSNTTGVDPK